MERRIRADPSTPDSEPYWRSQIDAWGQAVLETLRGYPFQERAIFAPIEPLPEDEQGGWTAEALYELRELRVRIDAAIERLSRAA